MLPDPMKSFSRHAHTYDQTTPVQKEVAKHLLQGIHTEPKRVLDLGCGSGELYRGITWEMERFDGVDCSAQMLGYHPCDAQTHLLHADFESEALFEKLHPPYNLILSSSALQWSRSLEAVVARCALHGTHGAFALFTCGTFRELYAHTKRQTFLPNATQTAALFERYFTCKHEVRHYTLHFEDPKALFRHIRHSGVSGGGKHLSIAQTRALLHEYPHRHLAFEVLFVWGESRLNVKKI